MILLFCDNREEGKTKPGIIVKDVSISKLLLFPVYLCVKGTHSIYQLCTLICFASLGWSGGGAGAGATDASAN